MAGELKVKDYVAYWLQTGKRLFSPAVPEGHHVTSIVQGDRYSSEFEECWAHVRDPASGDCYVEGMDQTIQDLLTSEWEVVSCPRCEMPMPMMTMGVTSCPCPCSDLELWPNLEIPQPRSPIDSNAHLMAIRSRLLAMSRRSATRAEGSSVE